MQLYKYLLLSVLLTGTATILPTELSQKELEAAIQKMMDKRFAEHEKYMKRIMPRRLLHSPFKLLGVTGMVAAWGYWFTQTHPQVCNDLKLKTYVTSLQVANTLQEMIEKQQQAVNQPQVPQPKTENNPQEVKTPSEPTNNSN